MEKEKSDKSAKVNLVQEVQKIIAEYGETRLTLRQIFYQLVSKHIIANTVGQYKKLSKVLVNARHNAEVDWESMEDRTREATGGDEDFETPEDHFNSIRNYFENCWKHYRLPFWKDQDNYVEVWFEKQALSGIFEQAARPWKVVQFACKGYSSHTAGYELKKRIEALSDGMNDNKKVHIVYFGDWDPSGVDIYRFIQDMATRFGLDISFERVGITPEQIAKYKIPPVMAKSSDSRYSKFVAEHGRDVVELDALRPDVLIGLIEASIKKHFDAAVRDKVKREENEGRDKIKDLISEYGGGEN